MIVQEFGNGNYAICADGTTIETIEYVKGLIGDIPLIVTDPPYGNVVDTHWDKTEQTDVQFMRWMLEWTSAWQKVLLPNAAFYVWGGIGSPGFRPFFRYLAQVEEETPLRLANLITWKKRRAYGVKHNYLFTREECAYFTNGDIKKPRCFNIPLLNEKRGYEGYNKKYPAKSEYYRRTNVWADITEMMRGKMHPTQKAQRVIEIPIEVHTHSGEYVVDPFAGSGACAHAAIKLGRKFVVVEKDEAIYQTMVKRLVEVLE